MNGRLVFMEWCFWVCAWLSSSMLWVVAAPCGVCHVVWFLPSFPLINWTFSFLINEKGKAFAFVKKNLDQLN
jgi:hypothetical protein